MSKKEDIQINRDCINQSKFEIKINIKAIEKKLKEVSKNGPTDESQEFFHKTCMRLYECSHEMGITDEELNEIGNQL